MVHRNNGHNKIVSTDSGVDPVNVLINKVQQVLDSDDNKMSTGNVIRVRVNLNNIDPFQWLKSQQAKHKVFWNQEIYFQGS